MSDCKHKEAYAIGVVDTVWQTYIEWQCDCGATGTVKCTREQYNKARGREVSDE